MIKGKCTNGGVILVLTSGVPIFST